MAQLLRNEWHKLNRYIHNLQEAELINVAKNGSISVLGVTTTSVLSHTATIFKNSEPTKYEAASIELSNIISDVPQDDKFLLEYISDTHELDSMRTKKLLKDAETIGFVDSEELDKKNKIYLDITVQFVPPISE